MIKNRHGISIAGLLVGVAIAGVAVLGLSYLVEMGLKSSRKALIYDRQWELISRAVLAVNDPQAWGFTLNDPGNTSLGCLRSGSPPCAANAGGPLNLRDKFDQILISTLTPNSGFTREGLPCTGFTPVENSACPIRGEVRWRPVCTACANPQIRLEINFTSPYRAISRFVFKNLPALTGSLVLHLRLDGPVDQPLPTGPGQILDSSGMGNHGTLIVNAAAPDFKPSPQGTAMQRMLNSWIQIPDSPSLRINGPVTMSAWIRMSPQPGPGQRWYMASKHNTVTWDSYGIRVADQQVWYCIGETVVTRTHCSRQFYNFQALTWYHIAGVWDGNTIVSYVNGVRSPTPLAYSGNIAYSGSFLYVGVENQNGVMDSGGLEEHIDEIRVWARALSDAEIMNQYLSER